MIDTTAFVPARDDRAVFVGQTGSGKTTLARVLLDARRYVVVLDVKGTLNWKGYELHRSLDALVKSKSERLMYRPRWQELQDPDELDAFFRWVYLRRNCTCYIDELMGVVRGDTYAEHFGACLTRGRELHVEMWMATQRPKRIPMVTLSEAEHTYIFRLKLAEDRDRMYETTGAAPELVKQRPKHDFYYSRQDGVDPVGPFRLNL